MSLVASIKLGDLDLTTSPYAWEFGSDLGKPELVTEALEQQLQDGEVVSATRASNREIVITVLVEATDLAAQADAEAALALECAKARNTLTYDPGGGAAATVFDTFVADMAFERSDEYELAGYRRWVLTIPALPYPRSNTLVTTAIPAPAATVTTTTLDDGTSLANWSVNTGWNLTTSGGAINLANAGYIRKNFIRNPSAEVDVNYGWTQTVDGSSTTVARSTAVAYSGSASVLLTRVGPTATTYFGVYANSPGPYSDAVTPGQTYTGSFRARTSLSSANAVAYGVLYWFNSSGSSLGGGTAGNPIPIPANTWVRPTVTMVAPAGAAYVTMMVIVADSVNIPNGTTVNVDAAMIEQTSDTSDQYFDGSLPATAAWSYAWSGTAHQSSSLAQSATAHVVRGGLAASTAGKPYLRIRYISGGSWYSVTPTVLVNGTAVSTVASSGNTIWVDVSAIATINTVEFAYSLAGIGGTYNQIDDLTLTNETRYPSTGRETSRIATVLGSARTQASLSVADTTPAALGSVLIYTCPVIANMAQPPLRDYLQAGPAITVDATTISGSRTPLSTSHTFDLPAASIQPGGHLLLARVRNTVTGTYALAWAGKSRMGTTDDTGQSGSTSVALTANTWTIVTVAAMNLPTREMGGDGKVRITLSAPANTELDEAWLFNVDAGRLTWVEAGTGTPASGGPASRLWLDAASLDNPEPSITLGTSATRSDELGAGEKVQSFGVHEFTPPQVNVFIATSGSTAAAVTLTHYPRWHTHVGTAA